MDQFRPRDDGPGDFRRQVEDSGEMFFRFFTGKALWLILAVVVLAYIASGFFVVGPGQKAVVLLFGKFHKEADSGLNYRLPWPFMTKYIVDIATVRRDEIGFRTERNGKTRTVPAESLMLTGDENIVDVELFVQYRVKDPFKYLFGADAPREVLRASAEVALRGVVGENTIDHTMTEGRDQVEQRVEKYLQKLLDDYQTGLAVSQAKLLVVDSPTQVREAFHDVVRAWEDRDRLIKEAEGYAADVVPKARGAAQAKIIDAEGYKRQRVLRAEGDAKRFTTVLDEYLKAPKVTRLRLYLESVEEFLSPAKKIIMDRNSPLLPLLPLSDKPVGDKVEQESKAPK